MEELLFRGETFHEESSGAQVLKIPKLKKMNIHDPQPVISSSCIIEQYKPQLVPSI